MKFHRSIAFYCRVNCFIPRRSGTTLASCEVLLVSPDLRRRPASKMLCAAFTSRHSIFPQPPQTKVRILSGMAWRYPHRWQIFVVGSQQSILTRSRPSFFAIHWALSRKSAKPRSPTFLPQSRCIALRFSVSKTSRSNTVASMQACFHCQSLRTLATFWWTRATSSLARLRAFEPFCFRLNTR